jgi:DNA-binding transcriptional MerR regulator
MDGEGPDTRLTIGELARSANVSTRTVRYYEERGILPPPDRSSGGTRRYRPEWRFYLEGALILKELGFSLDEIQTLGRLAYGEEVSTERRDAAMEMLDRKVAELERRTHVMEVIQKRVRDVIKGRDPNKAVVKFVEDARSWREEAAS